MASGSMAPGSVLVGVDSSPEARHALVWATADAARRRAPLHVVHVSPAFRSVPAPEGEPDLDMGAWVCRHALKRVRTVHPDLPVTADVWLGRPAGTLVEASARAALVVVGARSHGEVVGRFLGSVSQQLTMHAHCPVSVVRGEDASRVHGPVVVGVDSSPQAHAALEFAVADARRRGVGLQAVHAAYTDVVATELAPNIPDIEEALVAESARVAEMVEATAGRHPGTRIELVDERGHPVRVLTRYAEDAGVLVVGSRGRGASPASSWAR